ncbi:MAG: hypothetical protein Q8L98_04645 [Chlamydiales bacterium]|nr:hypothetical protein [Chlamydiales bacterium]
MSSNTLTFPDFVTLSHCINTSKAAYPRRFYQWYPKELQAITHIAIVSFANQSIKDHLELHHRLSSLVFTHPLTQSFVTGFQHDFTQDLYDKFLGCGKY